MLDRSVLRFEALPIDLLSPSASPCSAGDGPCRPGRRNPPSESESAPATAHGPAEEAAAAGARVRLRNPRARSFSDSERARPLPSPAPGPCAGQASRTMHPHSILAAACHSRTRAREHWRLTGACVPSAKCQQRSERHGSNNDLGCL